MILDTNNFENMKNTDKKAKIIRLLKKLKELNLVGNINTKEYVELRNTILGIYINIHSKQIEEFIASIDPNYCTPDEVKSTIIIFIIEKIDCYEINSDSFTSFEIHVGNYLTDLFRIIKRNESNYLSHFSIPQAAMCNGIYCGPYSHSSIYNPTEEEAISVILSEMISYTNLTPHEKLILEYFYGLNGKKSLSIKEIATKLKISFSNVTSILCRARNKLSTSANKQILYLLDRE